MLSPSLKWLKDILLLNLNSILMLLLIIMIILLWYWSICSKCGYDTTIILNFIIYFAGRPTWSLSRFEVNLNFKHHSSVIFDLLYIQAKELVFNGNRKFCVSIMINSFRNLKRIGILPIFLVISAKSSLRWELRLTNLHIRGRLHLRYFWFGSSKWGTQKARNINFNFWPYGIDVVDLPLSSTIHMQWVNFQIRNEWTKFTSLPLIPLGVTTIKLE